MKKSLLISSLIIIIVLLAEAYRENLNMEWQGYQKMYKKEIIRIAATKEEKDIAGRYQIKMRQLVLPELDRVDRCVICHVAVEDSRMKDMPDPVRAHPGDILRTHEVDKVGCTVCHDGQGRAITKEEAHAVSAPFWEKPLLRRPFLQSNCMRCHDIRSLPELELVRKGEALFLRHGCLGCHKLNGRGGNTAPDLTNMADANIHLKRPVSDDLADRFDHNANTAYIYESIKRPRAQPEVTAMPDFHFTDEEALAVTAFLKGLSKKAVPASYLEEKNRRKRESEGLEGEALYLKYCVACHGIDAKGGVKNINYVKQTVPALNTLAERMFLDDPQNARYVADLLKQGVDIQKMSPKLDVPQRGRVLAQYRALFNVVLKGSTAGKADPAGPEPLLHMPSWAKGLTERDINRIIAYLLTLFSKEGGAP